MTTRSMPKLARTEILIWAALAVLGGAAAGWIDSSASEVQASALVIMLVCFALTLPGRVPILPAAALAAIVMTVSTTVLTGRIGDAPVALAMIMAVSLVGAAGGSFAGRLLDSAAGLLDAGDRSVPNAPWSSRAASTRFLLAVALVSIAALGLPVLSAALSLAGHPAARWLSIVWQTMTLVGWIFLTPMILPRRASSVAARRVAHDGVRPIDLGTQAAIAIGLGLVHAALIVLVTAALFIPLLPSARALLAAAAKVYVPLDMLAYLAILTLGYLSDANRLRRAADQREAALRAESLDSRLTALRARLNPHFLFNALNSVTVLARSGKSDETASLTEGLTALLRYVLDDRRAMMPLREELDFARRYLAVQQVRFGPRLAYSVDADAGADSVLVPQLLLQPIVENAVEHGVARALDGGSVAVRAAIVDDRLHLTVEDDGPGPAGAAPSSGIGLANTRERLDRLYDGRASLTLTPGASKGARVAIILPLGDPSPA